MGANSKVNRENYITIQGFMITDLKLKGNELLIYACIYGFSQAEGQSFTGSLQYLADWTNSTKQSVHKCLKSLVEKGYLIKSDKIINGVKFCEYRTTELNGVLNTVGEGMQQSLIGGDKQSLTGGMQQSLPNNNIIDIDNKDNIDNKKENNIKKKKGDFDDIIEAYTTDTETAELLREWVKVRKAKRAAMTRRAIEMNVGKLDELAQKSGLSVNDYLKEIIYRGWAAFYEIKQWGKKYGATGVAIKPNQPDDLEGIF